MLDDVEHELVVEEPDEVEAAEAGGAAEGEVADDHGGVEAPAEEELPRRRHVVLARPRPRPQHRVRHALQPARPALQAGLLVQRRLEALLEPGDGGEVAAAHPAGLLLHVGEVDPVEVGQHLADLLLVLKHGARSLGQVVQAGVATQGLGEAAHGGQLDT